MDEFDRYRTSFEMIGRESFNVWWSRFDLNLFDLNLFEVELTQQIEIDELDLLIIWWWWKMILIQTFSYRIH